MKKEKEIQKFFSFRTLDTTSKFDSEAWIERILILGYPANPRQIIIHSDNKQAIPIHQYNSQTQVLSIRRPGPSVSSDWTLSIN